MIHVPRETFFGSRISWKKAAFTPGAPFSILARHARTNDPTFKLLSSHHLIHFTLELYEHMVMELMDSWAYPSTLASLCYLISYYLSLE